MARLRPINPAICPKCQKKNTKRVGYLEREKGSAWSCSDCSHVFTLPMLIVSPTKLTRSRREKN